MAEDKAKRAVEVLRSEALTKDKDSPKFTTRVEFEHDGIEFSVRKDAIFDAEVVEWMRESPDRALAKMLGAKKWAEWLKVHTDDEGFTIIYGESEDAPIVALIKATNAAVDPTKRSGD